MIRRNNHYTVTHRTLKIEYSPCETSQLEPNLRELLIKYQQGLDITDHVYLPAAKATAEVQFKNRVAKVDPLTEIPDYIKSEQRKANEMVNTDKRKSKSAQTQKQQQTTVDNPPTEV